MALHRRKAHRFTKRLRLITELDYSVRMVEFSASDAINLITTTLMINLQNPKVHKTSKNKNSRLDVEEGG